MPKLSTTFEKWANGWMLCTCVQTNYLKYVHVWPGCSARCSVFAGNSSVTEQNIGMHVEYCSFKQNQIRMYGFKLDWIRYAACRLQYSRNIVFATKYDQEKKIYSKIRWRYPLWIFDACWTDNRLQFKYKMPTCWTQ